MIFCPIFIFFETLFYTVSGIEMVAGTLTEAVGTSGYAGTKNKYVYVCGYIHLYIYTYIWIVIPCPFVYDCTPPLSYILITLILTEAVGTSGYAGNQPICRYMCIYLCSYICLFLYINWYKYI
jgi:hypothetical protein